MKRYKDVEEFKRFMTEKLKWLKKECSTIFKNPNEIAQFLAPRIREIYSVKIRLLPEKYLFVPEGERLPCCKGCSNEFGSCGTPCVSCEKMEAFQKDWTWHLWLPNEYSVYKRKEVKE